MHVTKSLLGKQILSTVYLVVSVASCPLALQPTEQLRFACDGDQDCLAGFRCQMGFCAAVDGAGAIVDVDIADAAIDDISAPADTSLAADTVLTDVHAQDLTSLDFAAADLHYDDNTAPDVRDASVADTHIADLVVADFYLPDPGHTDISSPDNVIVDTNAQDAIPFDWWDPRWFARYKVFMTNSGDEDLLDFPLLVVLEPNTFNYASARSDGRDLRMVDSNNDVLGYEIDTWAQNDRSTLWVRIPLLPAHSSGQFFWLYVGNPEANDGEDPGWVWNDYQSVWHMNVDPALDPVRIPDSSHFGKHGSMESFATSSSMTSQIGKAIRFDGDDIIGIENSFTEGDALDIVGGPVTFLALVYPTSPNGTIAAMRSYDIVQWQFQIEDFGSAGDFCPSYIWSDENTNQHYWKTAAALSTHSRYLLGLTVADDGRPNAFYVNGESVAFEAYDFGGAPVHRGINASIGSRWASGLPGSGTGFSFQGGIDELRISSMVRSAAWMRAQYLSMQGNMAVLGAFESR